MKKTARRLLAIVMSCLIMFLVVEPVCAATISDLQKQQEEIERQKQEAEQKKKQEQRLQEVNRELLELCFLMIRLEKKRKFIPAVQI